MQVDDPQWSLLLCKPSSQHAHSAVVHELLSHGFLVDGRRFVLSIDEALDLVLLYPAIQNRLRQHTQPQFHRLTIPLADGAGDATLMDGDDDSDASDDSDGALPEFIRAARRLRRQPDAAQRRRGASRLPDRSVLQRIQHTAQGGGRRHHSAANAGIAAAAPPPAGSLRAATPRLSLSQDSATASAGQWPSSHGEGNRGLASSRPATRPPLDSLAPFDAQYTPFARGKKGVAQSLDTALRHPALGDALVRQHVEHLLQDGTVLVLRVYSAGGLGQLCELCGPEDPLAAKRTAPHSWTARFGRDAVRNGFYTPPTCADAQAALRAVFPGAPATALSILPSSSGSIGGGGEWQPLSSVSPGLNATERPLSGVESTSPRSYGEEKGEGEGKAGDDAAVPPPPPLTYAAVRASLRLQADEQLRLSHFTGVEACACAAEAATPLAITAGSGSPPATNATPTAQTQASLALPRRPSATIHYVPAARYPERRERLDELNSRLRQRSVGC